MSLELARRSIDVGIVVTDPERMLAFYRDTLGLRHRLTRETGPGGAIHLLECGDSLVKLLEPPTPPQHRHVRGGTRAQTGMRYITIYVTNIDELVARCTEAGCHFPVPLRKSTGEDGGRYCQLEDPEGNIVQLQQAD